MRARYENYGCYGINCPPVIHVDGVHSGAVERPKLIYTIIDNKAMQLFLG